MDNKESKATDGAKAPEPKPDISHLALYKSALSDIVSGKFYAKESATSSDRLARAKQLSDRAAKLQQILASNGVVPSPAVWAQLIATVDEYFGLLGLIKEGESLAHKRVKVEFRTQNGALHSMPDCGLGSSYGDLRATIDSRLGFSGAARQLLCSGRPVSNEAQSLYQLSTAADGGRGGLGEGLRLQEVARTVGG